MKEKMTFVSAEALQSGQINQIKRGLVQKGGLSQFPKNSSLVVQSGTSLHFLKTKPMRTLSGVAPITIVTAPIACPEQAKCIYCPGGPNSAFGNTPKSYVDTAPAIRRAIRNDYDPYLQIFNRLEQLLVNGHSPSKVELIVIGGTFPSFPKLYRDSFMMYAFKALNDFSELFFTGDSFALEKFSEYFELPADLHDQERTERLKKKHLQWKGNSTLAEEHRRNERATIRCVALVIETRPDVCNEYYINEVLGEGTTRVEMGLQSLDDNVLTRIKRGHAVKDIVQATHLLKDSFLKVSYHAMLGLPGSTRDMDVQMFHTMFSDQAYQPDSLKIYPCLVLKGTPLYEEWKQGTFTPISNAEAAERIVALKEFIPEYCRIMRVQRNLPKESIEAGADQSNLRQLIMEQLRKEKKQCKCIRCREVKGRRVDWDNVTLQKREYDASGGKDIFLSYDDKKQDLLLGFCRLRIPYHPFRKEITESSAGIRELHVYGESVPVEQKREDSVQHKGMGKLLLQEAERIAREEFDCKKMLVISGVGVKDYYRKLQYKDDGVYMSKLL